MRKIIFLFVLVTNLVFGQNAAKKDLIKKLTESTCKCTNKTKVNSNNLKVTLGLCMFESINANKTEVFKVYNKKSIDAKLIENIGEDIGGEMLTVCPETMEMLLNDEELMREIAEDNNIEISAIEEEEEEDLSINGVFTETKIDGYLYVIVKENSGKINQFVILQTFENVFLITDKVLKTNEAVKVLYYELELYDTKLNKFIKQKIATDIIKL
jgi:hypothetical protein